MQIIKIALKNSDDKRLRSFNGITTYPYGTSAFMVCIEELKMKQALATYLNNQKLITAQVTIYFCEITTYPFLNVIKGVALVRRSNICTTSFWRRSGLLF